MRKFLFVLMIIISNATCSFAQLPAGQITIKNVFGGAQFFQNGERLSVSKVAKLMESNEAAYTHIKSAQSSRTLATILSIPGGFLVGWSLGAALAGAEPNWVLTGVGAGLIVASIPFSIKFNRQSAIAVDTYNEGLKASSFYVPVKASFCFKANAVVLVLDF